jgi:hypothetical protein
MATLEHPARHDRLRKLAAELSDARTRAREARRYGDDDGYRYARAEAATLRRSLEG